MIFINASIANSANATQLGLSAYADQSEFGGGYLNSRVNGIRECHIGGTPDDPQIVLSVTDANVGNAIRFQRFDDEIYDYVFAADHNVHGRWITERKRLERPGILTIPLATATAFKNGLSHSTGRKPVRIFVKEGTYLLFLGYAFDSSDEPEIGGVCEIEYRSPHTVRN
jgi:hypothetical protein